MTATYAVVAVQRVPQESGAPLYSVLGPLPATIRWEMVLNQPGKAEFTMDLNGVQANIKEALRDLSTKPLEIWVYRDAVPVFGGPVTGGDVTDKSILQITARTVDFYLNYMYVDVDQTYTAEDVFSIVKDIVDYWQTLDYGNYGIDTTAMGSPFGTDIDLFIPGATEAATAQSWINDLAVTLGFDYWVDLETRQLKTGTRGSDLSTGVFLERGVVSPAVQFAVGPDQIASEIFGTGTSAGQTEALTAGATNIALRSSFGRAGRSVTFDGVSTQEHLDEAVITEAYRASSVYFQPGPGLIPVTGAGILDFGVGDIVTYTFDSGLGLQAGAYRVRKREVDVSLEGQEIMVVEFE